MTSRVSPYSGGVAPPANTAEYIFRDYTFLLSNSSCFGQLWLLFSTKVYSTVEYWCFQRYLFKLEFLGMFCSCSSLSNFSSGLQGRPVPKWPFGWSCINIMGIVMSMVTTVPPNIAGSVLCIRCLWACISPGLADWRPCFAIWCYTSRGTARTVCDSKKPSTYPLSPTLLPR